MNDEIKKENMMHKKTEYMKTGDPKKREKMFTCTLRRVRIKIIRKGYWISYLKGETIFRKLRNKIQIIIKGKYDAQNNRGPKKKRVKTVYLCT